MSRSRLMQKTSLSALSAVVVAALLALPEPLQAADPTTADCLSANDSSISLRNEHKLRAAREQLLVCAAATCPADIRKECMRRVADVNAAIPTIVFEAKDASGRDLSAVKVTMDGQPLAERLEGTALSIDPGEHTFSFETAGQANVEKRFVIREGEKDRRERVSFGETAPPATTVKTAASRKTPETPNTMASEPPLVQPVGQRSSLGPQKIAAIVATGVGVIGVGVGAVFGAHALSKRSDASKACPDRCADQSGVDLWNSARSAGNVSTVAFIVGGVGLAAGATLWFTAKASTTPQVGIGPGSIELRGSW